jgi:hypothetical protein
MSSSLYEIHLLIGIFCRVGDWLPTDHRAHKAWLAGVISQVDEKQKKLQDLHPVIQEFKELIETNSRIYMLVSAMFEEIPDKHPYNKDMTGEDAQVRDYEVCVLLSVTTFECALDYLFDYTN